MRPAVITGAGREGLYTLLARVGLVPGARNSP